MPRDLPLSNGRLLVNFDSDYNLRDICYPRVGRSNHSRRRKSRTGVWVDNARFSAIDGRDWKKEMDYDGDSLATRVILTNDKLMLRLECRDVVDMAADVFLRKIEVSSWSNYPRDIKLFFHYDFEFWEVGIGDSIQYDPIHNVLVAYKDDCYFLMSGALENAIEDGISAWTTGHKDEMGRGGSWADAGDGRLDKVAASFGAVDGVIGIHQPRLFPEKSTVFYAWMVAGRNLQEVRKLNSEVCRRGPQRYIDRTTNFWNVWVNKETNDFADLPDRIQSVYKRSLLITRTNIDGGVVRTGREGGGGIVAAIDSDFSALVHGLESYSYVWPRDGAFVANALDKAGYGYISSRFYDFCMNVVSDRPAEDHGLEIPETESYMLHKFTVDGLVASNWMPLVDEHGQQFLPIQEDETAIIPYCMWQHYQKFLDFEALTPWYRPLVTQIGNFLCNFRETQSGLPKPSVDLWEERRGVYSYTIATVWAGLTAAANFSELFGDRENAERYRQAATEIKQACETHLYDEKEKRFLKQVTVTPDGQRNPDYTVDASLFALWYFGMFEPDDPRIQRTMQAVVDRLTVHTEIGGLARYEGDKYHWDTALDGQRKEIPGNPWIICNLWVAQYHIAKAKSLEELRLAVPILQWACDMALPSGVLPEQLHPLTGAHIGVAPLTWSNATFVATVCEYTSKYRSLGAA
ncbi:MAG: glycoside hydrolase family 15 protein [Chloroflexi bacterium]|nr:glycoside hydrolase family 15 protein [Chloroflexota bacterium]